jgi:hypothetical protein
MHAACSECGEEEWEKINFTNGRFFASERFMALERGLNAVEKLIFSHRRSFDSETLQT